MLTRAHKRLYSIRYLSYYRLPLYQGCMSAMDVALVNKGYLKIMRRYSSWVEVRLTDKGKRLTDWMKERITA